MRITIIVGVAREPRKRVEHFGAMGVAAGSFDVPAATARAARTHWARVRGCAHRRQSM
jgi:hypothetical protein